MNPFVQITKNSLTVAKYTFLEIYKSKVMINVLFLGLGLLALSYVASEFTYGVPQKIALEFGLGIITISAVAIAIFMGSTLLSHEINNRTAYLILARPISRSSFMLGKILGMGSILFIDIFILGVLSVSFYAFLGGEITSFTIAALGFVFIETLIVLLFVVFFSLFNNITLSIIYTIVIYFIGHSLEKLIFFLYSRDLTLTAVLTGISFFIPNLSKLNLKDHVIYQQYIEWDLLLKIAGYGFMWIVILLSVNMLIFSRKNLD